MNEKPLFIPLRTEHFDSFARGEKKAEFRPHGRRWNRDVCRVGRRVTISKGYGKSDRMHGVISSFSVQRKQPAAFVAIYGPGFNGKVARIGIRFDA